ncbi:MAG TPA: cytochrome d ubiquinol oxidase subunit II [Trueperaceae bacterium]|nr:cytochrome d ubiquinol oxidase subunit II [Trueperaceae bacterium]
MDINTIWYALIAVLFIGYFFLEGFDFGVGMLLPFVARGDTERRIVINTVGPFWDANEVWLITAGGAMFAAFPDWYATLFSGFYLPLFLILVALILRAVGFEFRGKLDNATWRRVADVAIVVGSTLPAFLWGVALTNLVRGVPIGADMQFQGGLLTLLSPFALLGGMVSISVFALHGALFLNLRADEQVAERARAFALRLWWPAAAVLLGFFVATYSQTDLFDRSGLVPGTMPVLAMIMFGASGVLARLRFGGWAFATTGLTIVLATVVAFEGLYPRVMPSSLGAGYDLTVYNASSSPMTLHVMLVVAIVFVPIVLAYQAYSYWVFRRRVTRRTLGG